MNRDALFPCTSCVRDALLTALVESRYYVTGQRELNARLFYVFVNYNLKDMGCYCITASWLRDKTPLYYTIDGTQYEAA